MNKSDYFNKWIELDEKVANAKDDNHLIIYVKAECYNNIFISNNRKNNRMFMIEFYPITLMDYKTMKVNGINISVEDNNNLDENKKYLVFKNDNPKMDDAFIAFSITVISNLYKSSNDETTLSQVEQILKDYKNFFAFRKSMDKKEEQGLVAELDYLNRLIEINDESVVINWTGSEKNKHDFVFENKAIEIKSTRNQEQSIVSISNENQLCKGKLDELLLKLYIFDENDTGKTVGYYIKYIYEKLKSFQYKKMFLSKLYLHNIEPLEYEGTYKFVIEEVRSYVVDDNFPRIDRDNIPTEAYDVKYKLNLSNIKFEKE